MERRLSVAINLLSLVILVWIGWQIHGYPSVDRVTVRASKAAIPSEPIALANGGVAVGSDDAPVVMVEYLDFVCPFCRRFAAEVQLVLQREYIDNGVVQLVIRQFPLDIHATARGAAEAVLCAQRQGAFLPFHDRLFQDEAGFDAVGLQTIAADLGLDGPGFERCLTDRHVAADVERDLTSARDLGVSGTPTFFIGIRQAGGMLKVLERIGGARPLQDFRIAIERIRESLTE